MSSSPRLSRLCTMFCRILGTASLILSSMACLPIRGQLGTPREVTEGGPISTAPFEDTIAAEKTRAKRSAAPRVASDTATFAAGSSDDPSQADDARDDDARDDITRNRAQREGVLVGRDGVAVERWRAPPPGGRRAHGADPLDARAREERAETPELIRRQPAPSGDLDVESAWVRRSALAGDSPLPPFRRRLPVEAEDVREPENNIFDAPEGAAIELRMEICTDSGLPIGETLRLAR